MMSAAMPHVEVGAYALGLLEEPDRRAFEAHLAVCATCHEELGALRGVAQTLDGIGPIAEPADAMPAPPEPAAVPDLLRHRIRQQRRHRAARALAAAAAGVVLLGGALGAGVTLGAGSDPAPASDDGTATLLREGLRTSATDAGSGVSGTVAVQHRAWGSRIALELSRVPGPQECELVAVDRRGNPHVVAGWSVPAQGYGLPDSPQPNLALQGGTALQPGEIDRFEVRTIGGGRTLLTVPA